MRSIKERIRAKINGWEGRLLSQAGRAVLVQAVGQAIPVYSMNYFKLPSGFLQEINMMLAGFWWGDVGTKRKMHWKQWGQLCISKLDGGLGFKDMEAFNLALLAKQWWRLIHNEDSLVFKVIKAKYFPYTAVSRAKRGPKASYLWSNLLEGKRVADQGSIWRIGDGQKVDVWKDRWIKKPPDFKVRCSDVIQPTSMKVEKLFYRGKREWNRGMIREVMNEEDASLVEKIPLSKKGFSDKLIWRESINGVFSVKSAYFEARRILQKNNVDRSNREELWRWLWTAKVIPKVKFFMWRLIMRAIPTGSRLQEKGIVGDFRCSVCGGLKESIQHVFFDCKLSKEVWNTFHRDMPDQCEGFMDDRQGWRKIFSFLKDKDLLEAGMIVCWLIWKNRNGCLHEMFCRNSKSILRLAEKMRVDYFGAVIESSKAAQANREIWFPPPRGIIKINVDASFNSNLRTSTVGAVARKLAETITFSTVSTIDNIETPLQAELCAILQGLQVARELNYTNIQLESDCLVAVKEINKKESSSSEWGSIIMDILELSSEFKFCGISHVTRKANILAHNLAKYHCDLGNHRIWRDTLPPFMCNPDALLN